VAPIPFLYVQIFSVVVLSELTLALVLGSALSCLKLLLVTNFNMIFHEDPEQLAMKIFILALSLAAIPNIIIGIYLSVYGINDVKMMQMASGNFGSFQGIHIYHFIYLTCWTFISVFMLAGAIWYIPYHWKARRQNNPSLQAAEAHIENKSLGLKKLLLVFTTGLGFFVTRQALRMMYGESNVQLFPFFVITLMPTVLLFLYTNDNHIRKFAFKIVSSKLSCLFVTNWRSHRVIPISLEEAQSA